MPQYAAVTGRLAGPQLVNILKTQFNEYSNTVILNTVPLFGTMLSL